MSEDTEGQAMPDDSSEAVHPVERLAMRFAEAAAFALAQGGMLRVCYVGEQDGYVVSMVVAPPMPLQEPLQELPGQPLTTAAERALIEEAARQGGFVAGGGARARCKCAR